MNNKVIITFSYLDYVYLKKRKIKNTKIININEPYFFDVKIDYLNFKLENFKIKPKRYKLDKILENFVGFNEFYFFIPNHLEENLLSAHILKKYILKYINQDAIILRIFINDLDKDFETFPLKNEEFLNILFNKILNTTINKYLSLLFKKEYGKYYYISNITIKILKLIKEIEKEKNKKFEKKIYYFEKIIDEEKNKEINGKEFLEKINNDYILFLIYSLFPYLTTKEIYKNIKEVFKVFDIEYDTKLNFYYINNYFDNNFKYKKKIISYLLYNLKLLKEKNLIFKESTLLYKNKDNELKFNYLLLKNKENYDNDQIFVFNILVNKIIYYLNEKKEVYLKDLIQKILSLLNTNEKISYQEFFYTFNYMKKKKLFYNNVDILKLNNLSDKILNLFQNFNLIIPKKINIEGNKNIKEEIIKLVNNNLNETFKNYKNILKKPSLNVINKYKKIKNIETIENVSLDEMINEIINYEKKLKPSQKQIELVKKILEENNEIKRFEEIISNKYNTSKFLYHYFKIKPSQKQIEFLKKIEKKYNLKINNKIYKNKKLLKKYISEFI